MSLELRRQGARCFVAPDAMRAAWGARETLPDALVTELELPDLSGEALLLELRSSRECASLPAVALAGNPSLLGRVQTRRDGFEKCLLKPVRPWDVVDAVCSIVNRPSVVDPFVIPSFDEVSHYLTQHDYRHGLALLNVSSHYRYTAVFRSEGSALRSVWTYDREWPVSDPFPFHVLLEETPCSVVLEDRAPLLVEDALMDLPRRRVHPDMRAFVGVPLAADQPGDPSGVLCHFDAQPSPPDQHAANLLARAARLLASVSRRPPASSR